VINQLHQVRRIAAAVAAAAAAAAAIHNTHTQQCATLLARFMRTIAASNGL
jgi:hypothetical protein